METSEAVKLLRSRGGVKRWNALGSDERACTSLVGVDLSFADLRGVELAGCDLTHASFVESKLGHSVLTGATLLEANFFNGECNEGASLRYADLTDADLQGANLALCDLGNANLTRANLKGAHIDWANLRYATLNGACLQEANLGGTNFVSADLCDVDVRGAHFIDTILGGNLSGLIGVDETRHGGPSYVVEQLVTTCDEAAESLLRKCGLSEWEVLSLRLRDTSLTADEFVELQYRICAIRNSGPLFIGGVFISYSHEDSKLVDELDARLREDGATTWLDKHDMIAGDMQKQVSRGIRINDIVLLVLSESSVQSDWVEHELEMARDKEKREGRDVLCPIALDDSWKAKMNDVLWRQIKKKNVLDFSGKSGSFDEQFQKLVDGMKVNYSATPAASS